MSHDSWLFLFGAISALGGIGTIIQTFWQVGDMSGDDNPKISISKARGAFLIALLCASLALGAAGFFSVGRQRQISQEI